MCSVQRLSDDIIPNWHQKKPHYLFSWVDGETEFMNRLEK